MEKHQTLADAIAAAGLGYPDIINDGQIHRFKGPDDRNKNCWYVSHGTAGAFGSWKLGFDQTWSDGKSSGNADLLRQMQEQRRQRTADLKIIQRDTANDARKMWEAAARDIDHAYPAAKNITAYGARQDGNILLVPMYHNGKLLNLQRIYPDGSKRFLKGGRVTGCYHPIGTITDTLLVCEGYATGCTLHEQTGLPVAIAFNASNLRPVALRLYWEYRDTRIVIAADNDMETERRTGINPGLEKAREAAAVTGGQIIFPGFSDINGEGTDFNDYVNCGGAIGLSGEME